MRSIDNKNQKKIPEVLAPAGTWEALEAAVNACADAVYLGGDLFSARAFAGNFKKEELIRAIRYCHLFDVKVYLTVNTLLKDSEIESLVDYLRPFYEAGVDAVLVQDMGAASLLKKAYPALPLHASTQMSISSHYGAAFLKSQGFTRIVPARELTLEEIRAIKETTGMEIETFVHGAMCFAYSGKCLFSSFLGGRSGNRGRCAQPCRQCYEVSGAAVGSEYALSLKDMCTLSIMPELIEAGIDSFKIEGRMKNPAYVYAVTKAYVEARDLYDQLWKAGKFAAYRDATQQMQKQLADVYNRGGFCTGYYHTEKGPEMAANKRPNHDGLRIGHVEKVAGPEVQIKLSEPIHPQDVVEIRPLRPTLQSVACVAELTCSVQGRAGETIRLKGKNLKAIRKDMPVFRTKNQALLSEIEEALKKERTVPVRAFVTAKEGLPLTLRFEETDTSTNGTKTSVTVQGSPVQAAGTRPVDKTQILEKLKKTGGSHLCLQTEVEMDDHIFLSMSELNRLRREAAERFKQAKAEAYCRRD